MSRTRVTLAAAVLATGAFAVPAALAHPPECDKVAAGALAEGHELADLTGVDEIGNTVHLAEETYCATPLP